MRLYIKILLALFVIAPLQPLKAQNRATTYSVKDSATMISIPDCAVFYTDKDNKRHSTTTSSDGVFYVVKENTTTVYISHIGYESKTIKLSQLNSSTVIYLRAKSVQLDSVTVYSSFNQTNRGNIYKYTPLQAASSISVIGEPDVLRHISSLPSVSQGIDGTLGLFIRGGNNGSNGIYFNDVPMYVSSHLMGLFSVFPADMVSETTFFTGGLPAVKGNQSSSLLDVGVRRIYGTKFNGKFTLSPYMSGIYTSIPLIKEKLSIQLSGRTSFIPYIINMIPEFSDQIRIQIYDLTSTIDYRISNRHYLDAMFYMTNDYFSYKYKNGTYNAQNWRSKIGKLGWRSILSDRLNLYVWGYYNTSYSAQKGAQYRSKQDVTGTHLGISSALKEFSFSSKLNYSVNERLSLNAGVVFQHQTFIPSQEKYLTSDSFINYEEINHNRLLSFFGEARYEIDKLIDLKLGYRHTFQRGDRSSNSDFDLHFLSHIRLNENFGIELTFDRMNQYYHVLEGLPTGWSLNIMTPSTNQFPSELTYQYFSGLFYKKEINKMFLNFSLGGYYRSMKNIVTYTNGMNVFGLEQSSWKDNVDIGNGRSYGLELSGSVQADRFGTTLAYTLSKSDREFPEINDGEKFPFKFDRRHILNLQTKFTIAKYKTRKGKGIEHILNSVISYSTGNRATIPIGNYQGEAPPYWGHIEPFATLPDEFFENIYDRKLMSSKNGFVMRDYFRIDIAYTLKLKGKKVTNEFSLSIFNVLNRHNPYTYFYENREWKQLSIMPIMPNIRWSISW